MFKRGNARHTLVAPYMGAWIETHSLIDIAATTVAPYMGAWIETAWWATSMPDNGSHPIWVRGLKR